MAWTSRDQQKAKVLTRLTAIGAYRALTKDIKDNLGFCENCSSLSCCTCGMNFIWQHPTSLASNSEPKALRFQSWVLGVWDCLAITMIPFLMKLCEEDLKEIL
ncbi:Perakine reductase [Senna tora]|uniref:Perakine reductase n=1 Tax=Senna tora TaxID=362788 RepID=A0A834WIK8_9FABA|nr:Perakine reductase [Senna tora]